MNHESIPLYLDTHAVVWLYAGETERFSTKTRSLIEANNIFISPMVQLELQYLNEIERISTHSAVILENLMMTIGLRMCEISFSRIISEAVLYNWTRDPFDRIIVATAAASNAMLITKDQSILSNYKKAVWN